MYSKLQKVINQKMLKTMSFLALVFISFLGNAQTTRFGKFTASGNASGSTWANASSDIQAMINASSAGDEIWVQGLAGNAFVPNRKANATGTITPNDRDNAFVLKDGVKMYGGFFGDESSLQTRHGDITILSGNIGSPTTNGDTARHVVIAAGLNTGTTFNQFHVRDGFADGNGAITIPVNGQNIAQTAGGAIAVYGGSSLLITNCIFSDNNAALGGAIANTNGAAPIIATCTFTNNKAVGAYGGAIYSEGNSPMSIANSTFTGNTATRGGAVYNIDSDLKISASTFKDNSTSSFGSGFLGGAIHVNNSALTLTNSVVSGNKAFSAGGIDITGNNKSHLIANCTITENTAVNNDGGGLWIGSQSSGVPMNLTLINCNISNNACSVWGGALANYGANVRVVNCTLAGNNGYTTIYTNGASGSAEVINSIIYGNNTAGQDAIYAFTNTTATASGSIVQGATVFPGSYSNADPLFYNVATKDYRLLVGSPAVNTGNAFLRRKSCRR
ncbi:MAG: right-handed parallel beta-helix repeat-containing protein [Chitinophagaceae bacterium]|jgi:predicted outer membrane repeat protein|nr:right-handed parallel beta-helix repeat-containing protein [Chitinophagaceae bacterium]